MGDLTTHFSRREFACHCGCGKDDVAPELVFFLEMLRDRLGRALNITSGVRCALHNTKVGGGVNSAHLRGLAADIACANGLQRHELVSLALHSGINRIGIGPKFVHLDLDKSLAQEVMWLY
jgi:uncharacterized protein YcbK (DUF882 family)